MKIDPVPLHTPILENSTTFNHVWFVWLRNISQYFKESQTIVSATNYEYCVNGSLLTLNYSGNGEEELNLPYKSASNQIINYWDGDISKKLEIYKNDLKITIPNGVIKFTATIMVRQ